MYGEKRGIRVPPIHGRTSRNNIQIEQSGNSTVSRELTNIIVISGKIANTVGSDCSRQNNGPSKMVSIT